MSVVIYILLLFFSIIGLCEVIHSLSLSLFDIKSNRNKIVCCVLNDEKADIQLQFVVEQYRWLGRKYADKIIAVNAFDAENETLLKCREIALKHDIALIDKNQLLNQMFYEDLDGK